MDYYNTDIEKSQDDNLDEEIEYKFTPKKQASELLSASYARLGLLSKSSRVAECGTFLEFRSSGDVWKLHFANFCRDRLCPMCSWRRTYKIYSQISRIMNVIQNDYVFLFLTLTVPNCSASELSSVVDKLQTSWKKFVKYKRFSSAVQGFFKVLEVTRNTDKKSKSYDTYHPHLHSILAVKRCYLCSRDYIPHSEWLELWRKATNDKSITQVDIRLCKSKNEIRAGELAVKSLGSAVAEVAKYSVKASHYLGIYDSHGVLVKPFPAPEIDKAVLTLGTALHGRRLVSLGGIFDDVAKKLNLDNIEDGDLVHLDETEMRSDVALMIRRYSWGAGAYRLI